MPQNRGFRRVLRSTNSRRLHVEALEDRRMLAVGTFDSLWNSFDSVSVALDGQPSYLKVEEFGAFSLDRSQLQLALIAAPLEFTADSPVEISLPSPDGKLARFEIVESPIMAPELAADFGDAPDTGAGTGSGNYETLAANGGPSHTINVTQTALFLGNSVDGDSSTLQNVRASADDVNGALPDDEDEDGVLDGETENKIYEAVEVADGVYRTIVPGEIVVGLLSDDPIDDYSRYLTEATFLGAESDSNLASWFGSTLDVTANGILTLDQTSGGLLSVVSISIDPLADVEQAVADFAGFQNVAWAEPNYQYSGDILDLTPNDPQFGSQTHHSVMNNPTAWDTTLGDSSVVIAITDEGVDLDHEDLAANIWVNPGEIAGNDIDDDNNGFIDDVNGWDFVTDDNDPNPFDTTSDNDHGTHVAGIAAAVTNNNIGVAGTAGGASIMALRIFGPGGGFTTTMVSDAFRYAVDNGAKIINSSFAIDEFVGNQTFTAGLQYLYDNGGLHFNSAGNRNEFNPIRQEFHQTLLVANTNNFDARHSFSNYGTGIDIAAPGVSILSTLPADGYGTKTGTSMSAPNAAGAAALIWSANPTWTRDQVAARLVGTADNIDAANPSLAGLLGRGRVNAAEAVSTTPLPAPQVEMVNGLPVDGSVSDDPAIDSFSISFNQIMDPPTINDANNFDLRGAGQDSVFDTADDVVYSLTYPTYMIGTNQVEFGIDSGSLAPDNYRLTVQSGGTQNPFGTDLDGDADGTAGDNFVQTFTTINLIVDNTTDEDDGNYSAGDLSLREAILLANDEVQFPGPDTITFSPSLSGETITLGGTDIEITETLTIDATALTENVVIDANQQSRIFSIGTSVLDNFNVTLAGLTLTGGRTTGTATSGFGGAIRSVTSGTLTIDRSTVSGNSTAGDVALGGGIRAAGLLLITQSTVSGNSTTGQVADGGGIFSSGAVILTQSTISGNSTTGNGSDGAGIYARGTVTFDQSTVTDNHANHANSTGGGIWNNDDPIEIANSIIAGNTAGGGSPDLRPGTGTLNVNYSLIGTSITPIGGANNVVADNPLLGPLTNNFGPTETHALLSGSPALDVGDPSIVFNPSEFDQRGEPYTRVSNGRVDIGAFEFQPFTLVVSTTDDVTDGDLSPGNFSLREAIEFANVNSGADSIVFSSLFDTPQTILLGSQLAVTDSLLIAGPGQDLLTIDAQQNSRIIEFDATAGNLSLEGLTLQNGQTNGGRGGGILFLSSGKLMLTNGTLRNNSTEGNDAQGGGIFTPSGEVTLSNSTLSGNSTAGSSSEGGGIYTSSGAVSLTDSTLSGNSTSGNGAEGGGISTNTGEVTLTNSTLNGNSTSGFTSDGGGIRSFSGAVTLINSTLSGNSTTGANANGGGMWIYDAAVMILNSTVTENSTNGSGGGIGLVPGSFAGEVLTIRNSIVAGNTDDGTAPEFLAPGNPVNDLIVEYSLIGDNRGSTLGEATTPDGAGNLVGSTAGGGIIDPLLGALANNGGPTETHSLLPGSPALDAGDPTALAGQNGVPDFDQRGAGFGRVQGTLDIGAFEVQLPAFPDGDYNHNGIADTADYTVWLDTLGSTTNLDADGNGNSVVDQADYDFWKANFGNTTIPSLGTGTGEAALAADKVVSIEVAEPVVVAAPIIVASQVVAPQVVTPPSPLPASLNSELVDLAFPFVLQDRNGYVPRAKTSLTNSVQESTADVDLLRFYEDVKRPTNTTIISTIETRRDEESRDSVQRRHAWEDALDEVFGKAVFAEELETV